MRLTTPAGWKLGSTAGGGGSAAFPDFLPSRGPPMERNAGRAVPFKKTAGLQSRAAGNTAPRHIGSYILAAARPLT